MIKETNRFKVPFDFDWTYGVSIEQLRKDLDELEKLGVKEIEIEPLERYGNISVKIEAYTEREETDEELQIRINQEKERNESIKRRELEELARLKAKYKL